MIKERQNFLNRINLLTDAIIIYICIPLAFWLRFYVLPDGIATIPIESYLVVGFVYTLGELALFLYLGLYRSYRKIGLAGELFDILRATLLSIAVLLAILFVYREIDYSRVMLAIFYFLSLFLLCLKRVCLRLFLRGIRAKQLNLKHIILIGNGKMASRYIDEIAATPVLGFRIDGYIAREANEEFKIDYLGGYDKLTEVLEKYKPDEVVSAVSSEDYKETYNILEACEKAGIRIDVIPIYAEVMSSKPKFDDLNGIPLLNVRYVPLDNFLNAFIKRTIDIAGSLIMLIVLSPLMLISAVGVKLSSPGPIIFKQVRVGRGNKPFNMYKFRSMQVNDSEERGWSGQTDSRRTGFGAFMRKCSIDELPQLWNVLKGDMSLVGPRPEVPFFVEQFKEAVPLYMVRHQVRPGITGLAQVSGLRGDTSIPERIRCDIKYIENWNLALDIKILLTTVFRGKFINDEKL
ncbi:MAG: undecaprenyl-phosphate glucose phosphotransferase [Oscillospiraceae bacterium]|nr:undecaprenyl-phosphate glucose phosphotransferase [Oscillospiraceae bacterium]